MYGQWKDWIEKGSLDVIIIILLPFWDEKFFLDTGYKLLAFFAKYFT